MSTRLRRDRVPGTGPDEPGTRGLCLAVAMVAACSVDVSKLQPWTSPVADAAKARSDAAAQRPNDADTGEDLRRGDGPLAVADAAPAGGEPGRDSPRDLPEPAWPEDAALADDAAGDPDVPLADGDTGDDVVSDARFGTGGAGGTVGDAGGNGGTEAGPVDGQGTGGVHGDPDLVLWYKLDESSGTAVADSSPSGGPSRDGTLTSYGYGTGSTATFTTESQVGTHALSLTPSPYGAANGGWYVTLPVLQSLAPDALTLAVWIKLTSPSSQVWERILDCGSGTVSAGGYYYITTRAKDAVSGAPVRFGISETAHKGDGEQRLEGSSTLSANVWHHIAVVLPSGSPYTGTLYIDGEVADTNNAMTLHLSDVAVPTNHWIGRSTFAEDPFLAGVIDDFRVYRRALTNEEIATLFALR